MLNSLSAAYPLLDVTFFDTYSLANQMYEDPGVFGFTNITDPALINSNTVVSNPDEYFYWDDVHPITRWHEIVAGEAIAALESQPIPEPSTIFLLGTGLAGLVGVSVRRRFKRVRK